MANITVDMIKELRDRTGAGIMDCKKALIEKDGDVEKAIDLLREKGMAKAAKRASRVAAEGLALIKREGDVVAIAEVNCETDFVSASDKFHELVDKVLDTLIKKEPKSVDEAKELTSQAFADAAVAMGEKFDLRRFQIFHLQPGEGLATYIHGKGKIAVLAVLSKQDDEIAEPLAMSICQNAPLYLNLNDVPEADRAHEAEVAAAEVNSDPKLAGKPEAMKQGIIANKVKKSLSKDCLVLQEYILDPNKKIQDVLNEHGVQIKSFARYQVGEGIAK